MNTDIWATHAAITGIFTVLVDKTLKKRKKLEGVGIIGEGCNGAFRHKIR
jgi:hypothetical protein